METEEEVEQFLLAAPVRPMEERPLVFDLDLWIGFEPRVMWPSPPSLVAL